AGGLLQGCDEARPVFAEPTPSSASGAVGRFDPATAGTIQGQVRWLGETPLIEPLTLPANPLAAEVLRKKQVWPNPNAPRIEEQTKGVADAVIFLRGVDVGHARPWDHPPVRVEQRACAFHVR